MLKITPLIQSSFIISLLFLASANVSADASFSAQKNQLTIPFVQYQGQFLQAHLSYLPPNKLKLEQVDTQNASIDLSAIVPVYNDLSLHLESVDVASQLYAVDLHYLGNNIFQFDNLNPSFQVEQSLTKFRTEFFSGSGICAQCHNEITDNKGKDVSIVSTWSTTMMANATRDPFWQAKVRSELNRTPKLSHEINDKCSRCHAPMANEEAKKRHDNVQNIFDNGLLNNSNPYYDLAMDGVSCTLCHQISPEAPFGTEASFSGNFSVKNYQSGQDRLIYGPFKNVRTGPMQNFTGFTPVFSEHIKASELCASCHDLTTPYTDEQGTVLTKTKEDEFPEQMPYSEWLHSEFAKTKSCQQCHMPRANGVIIASRPFSLTTKRDNFAQHSFLGSNQLMLSILENYRNELGVSAKDFSTSIINAEQLLKDAAKISIITPTLKNKTLDFKVHILSKTGHKLPSAYPSRRVILHVTVKDDANNIIFESGKVNADGSVVGLNSDINLADYEPHYQVINSPQQVQVYESIMQDYKNNITYIELRAKSYKKDNRLLPKGFNKQTASKNIKVLGAAANDADFIGGEDTIRFTIGQLKETRYHVTAELIYQPLSYSFAQDLFLDNSPETKRFKQMFNASTFKSTPMTSVNTTINR